MMEFDPNAPQHPECAACKQGWPVHVDAETGKRFHMDIFYTPEHGIVVECPTPRWIEEEPEDDTGTGEETSGTQS